MIYKLSITYDSCKIKKCYIFNANYYFYFLNKISNYEKIILYNFICCDYYNRV